MARFLVIDDEPAVNVTFARMLGVGGHDVRCVDSAQAALASLDHDLPDAIILDIRMPGMGGMEFFRVLRASPRGRAIPVGVVTGDYFLKEEILAEIAAHGGAVRYKPLWLTDVTTLAEELLGHRPPTTTSPDSDGH